MMLDGCGTFSLNTTSAEALQVLYDAMEERALPMADRVFAESKVGTTEGLALMKGYLSINDAKVRQAIVDVLLMIAPAGRP